MTVLLLPGLKKKKKVRLDQTGVSSSQLLAASADWWRQRRGEGAESETERGGQVEAQKVSESF